MNSTYANAPITELVAVQCAVCARPLADAVSVQRGVGPDCAAKYGMNKASGAPDWKAVRDALGDDEFESLEADLLATLGDGEDLARAFGNRLAYRIAADQRGPRVQARVVALSALGFGVFAARIADRLGAVRVEVDGDTLVVKSPWSVTFLNQVHRKVPRHHFDRARECRIVPMQYRSELWEAIRAAFRGELLIAPSGIRLV